MGRRFFAGLVMAMLTGASASAMCIEHKIFDGILKANVDNEGFVDYPSIRVNKGGDLYEYIAFLEDADLTKCGPEETLAFWINAYNAHAIRLILARPQLTTLSDDFKLFGEKFKVAGHNLTLNEIQHRVLRSSPKNGGPLPGLSVPALEPRLHFALSCGAIGGPRLLRTAYNPKTLEEQLQSAAAAFANDPKHLAIENGALVVSSILRWYEQDFAVVGGVASYLSGLTDPSRRADAADIDARLSQDFPANTQHRFDWTVNTRTNKPTPVAHP